MSNENQLASKKPKRIFDRRSIFFSVVVLILFCVLVYLQLSPKCYPTNSATSGISWSSQQQKELAMTLENDDLWENAIKAYEKYMASPEIDAKTRANICFKIGEMYFKHQKYESAIAYYQQALISYPETELKPQINESIANSWERAGKEVSAKYVLENATALDQQKSAKPKRGAVVAQIGKEEITMGDLDDALQKMPSYMQKQYSSKSQKLEFLRQYLAQELLYRKAVRAGYEKDNETREKLEDAKKSILVQKVVENETKDKPKITDSDAEMYYKANLDQYKDKARAKISYMIMADEDKANAELKDLIALETEKAISPDAIASMQIIWADCVKENSIDVNTKDKAGKIDQWITKGAPIPEIGSNQEFNNAIFETEAGKICSKVIKTEKGYVIFKIDQKQEEKQRSFDEVKDNVKSQYGQEKEQQAVNELIKKTLSAEDVKIFDKEFVEPEQKNTEEKPGK